MTELQLVPWREVAPAENPIREDERVGRYFGRPLQPPPSEPDPELPDLAVVVENAVIGRIWCRPHSRPPEVENATRAPESRDGVNTRPPATAEAP